MKSTLLKKTAALALALALLLSVLPNVFTTTASADYRVVGYNMVLYVTQTETSPHYRQFRSYSINKDYETYGARTSYGEKHMTKYVTADQLRNAVTYSSGTLVRTDYPGYIKCCDTAYYFGDPDGYVWFIESVVYDEVAPPPLPHDPSNVWGSRPGNQPPPPPPPRW